MIDVADDSIPLWKQNSMYERPSQFYTLVQLSKKLKGERQRQTEKERENEWE